MAKKTEEKEVKAVKAPSAREQRWAEFLAAYALQSPEKYAKRKEAGELETPPESFV